MPRPPKRQPPVHSFIRERQMVTRFQDFRIRETFPFLDLPPELRNMVYDRCIEMGGVNKWLDEYWSRIKSRPTPDSKVKMPSRNKNTPSILLVNHQIYAEAHDYLRKRSLTFTHGLFALNSLSRLISTPALREVTSITLTTSGHPILEQNCLTTSWRGHMRLIENLVNTFAWGHNLRSFTLDFACTDLETHVGPCWTAPGRCDFRDDLKSAIRLLSHLHSIPVVTVTGIPEPEAAALVKSMQRAPLHLLDLPAPARNKIYALCGYWTELPRPTPGSASRLREAAWDLATPSILLLNKRISAEAHAVLRAVPMPFALIGHRSPRDHINLYSPVHPALSRHSSVSPVSTPTTVSSGNDSVPPSPDTPSNQLVVGRTDVYPTQVPEGYYFGLAIEGVGSADVEEVGREVFDAAVAAGQGRKRKAMEMSGGDEIAAGVDVGSGWTLGAGLGLQMDLGLGSEEVEMADFFPD